VTSQRADMLTTDTWRRRWPGRHRSATSMFRCALSGDHRANTAAGEAAAPSAKALPARLLDDGEVVVLFLRPHPLFILLNPLGGLAALALLTTIGWFGLVRTGAIGAGGGWFMVVGVALMLARLGWSVLDWWNRIYVLTDRRVIRRRGVLRVSLFQAPLRRIQHLTLYFSIRERFFALGTVGFSTAGTGIPEAYWITIAKPVAVHRTIQQTIDKYAGPRVDGVG
jgi:membrane protein YdbS with pleckstrin-like domain